MTVVYYDLETTGLNHYERQRGVQIVSIGAVTENGAQFHRYLIPTCGISEGATEVHGITKIDGEIYKNGWLKPNALRPRAGLQAFMDWLESEDAQCLVSHNNLNFDSIVLKNAMSMFGVPRPKTRKWFFVDSLEVMRDAMPYYEDKDLNSCMQYYFDEDQPTPHNALHDAKCVKRICEHYAQEFENFDCFDSFLDDNLTYVHPF